jgi:hypothetical protein
MVPASIQETARQTSFLETQKEKKRKHKEGYHNLYYQNNKSKYQKKKLDKRTGDRHKLNRKTRYRLEVVKSEGYQPTNLAKIVSENLVLSGGQNHPYIALNISKRTLFFYTPSLTNDGKKWRDKKDRQQDYLFAHLFLREKEELEKSLEVKPKRFRQKLKELRLKTLVLGKWDNPANLVAGYLDKGRPRPSGEAVGWNQPDYREIKERSLATLAFTHDIVLGKIGSETPLLDLDPNKKDSDGNYRIPQEWLRKDLSVGGKKWQAIIRKYQIPYYWTTATAGNCLIPLPFWFNKVMSGSKVYHRDSQQSVADLLAQGDLVALPVGADKNRQLVITEWGQKLVNKYGEEGLFKRTLFCGNIQGKIEELLNSVFLTLQKPNISLKKSVRLVPKKDIFVHHLTPPEKELKKAEFFGSKSLESVALGDFCPPLNTTLKSREIGVKKVAINAKILSKQKTCLAEIWKVFYLDWKTQQTGYFLVNDYQRSGMLANLSIGCERNILLVNGWKHAFLSRIC